MFTGVRVMGVVLLCCLGCGNGKRDGASKSGPQTYAQLSAAIAESSCRSRADCCSGAGIELDVSDCVDAYTARLAARDESDTAAGIEYDDAIGARCLRDLKALLMCGKADDAGNTLNACDQLFHGDTRPGEPCEDGRECARGVGQDATCSSDYLAEGSAPVCVVYTKKPAKHAAAGDACVQSCEFASCVINVERLPAEAESLSDSACFYSDGLYCGGDQVCVPLLEAGEPCAFDFDCASDAYCQPTAGTTASACVKKVPNGADCSAAPASCASGYCDEEGWQCAEPPAFGAAECTTSG